MVRGGGCGAGGGVWVGDTFNNANHSGSNILYCFLFSMVKMKCSLSTIYCSLNFLSTLKFFSSFVSSSLLFLSDWIQPQHRWFLFRLLCAHLLLVFFSSYSFLFLFQKTT